MAKKLTEHFLNSLRVEAKNDQPEFLTRFNEGVHITGDKKLQCKGNSSACHPCRDFHILPADDTPSNCCLLLPRESRKSFNVYQKTGRGGGDRTHDLRLKRPLLYH